MSEFENVRQRKLQKEESNSIFRRTISIEDAGTEYVVKIEDSHSIVSNFGLLDPNNINAPTSNFTSTAKATPTIALDEAIQLADEQLKRSVEHEQFRLFPAGVDFTF
jgi:hypothetical protein